jgi:AraC family transcriptional regulator, regulatory protein of adaptative response / methylated-DNA-[protein]-cysteine methyltransferase
MQEEKYWQAVLTRDTTCDGTFVYAVRSTGIYCNPSCPSRRPQRKHVLFFSQPTAAEQAGFRACQRCHPDEATLLATYKELVQKVCRYIEGHLDESLTLATLSVQVHLSPYYLQRIFKRIMGITPRQYAEAYRLQQLKTQLKHGASVTGSLYDVGYTSSSQLYERTPTQLGMTPTTYRRGGKDMSIHYTIVPCPLGYLLVAATSKGICAVSLGDSEDRLAATLSSEYPAATIQRDDTHLQREVNAILAHLDGQQPDLALPLDIQATAFQRLVWQELQNIPYGSTRSYSAVARAIGNPKATRAVAHACATNPTALIIPCHRVVHENGDVGGYRWGSERKQRLLAQEQQQMR